MNALGFLFALVVAVLLCRVPRHWVVLPLLLGASFVTSGQTVQIGPFSFTVVRLLIAVGFVRVVLKGERLFGGMNGLDWAIILWGALGVCASAFHEKPGAMLVSMLGQAYDGMGVYLLLRVFINTIEDLQFLTKLAIVVLVPIAAEMILEKLTGKNAFAIFGYIPEQVAVRYGKIRAQGPFGHSILAGTVGAILMPLTISLWRYHSKLACLGLIVGGAMVVASASKRTDSHQFGWTRRFGTLEVPRQALGDSVGVRRQSCGSKHCHERSCLLSAGTSRLGGRQHGLFSRDLDPLCH